MFRQRDELNGRIDWYSAEMDRLTSRINGKRSMLDSTRGQRDQGYWVRMLRQDMRDLQGSRRNASETRRGLIQEKRALGNQIRQACQNRDQARDAFNAAKQRTQGRREGLKQESGWHPRSSRPPRSGTILNDGSGPDYTVSFKIGYGTREGDTLIADGDYSDDRDGFNNNHDHAGWKREPGGGYFFTGRGNYTGPGS